MILYHIHRQVHNSSSKHICSVSMTENTKFNNDKNDNFTSSFQFTMLKRLNRKAFKTALCMLHVPWITYISFYWQHKTVCKSISCFKKKLSPFFILILKLLDFKYKSALNYMNIQSCWPNTRHSLQMTSAKQLLATSKWHYQISSHFHKSALKHSDCGCIQNTCFPVTCIWSLRNKYNPHKSTLNQKGLTGHYVLD